MTIQKINKILKDSKIEIFKEKISNLFSFKIKYGEIETDTKQLEELRNKILMSSTNTNLLKRDEKVEKKEIMK